MSTLCCFATPTLAKRSRQIASDRRAQPVFQAKHAPLRTARRMSIFAQTPLSANVTNSSVP
jgi:hypothetical protein